MKMNQIEKSLKHFLKRKMSITQSVVVGFLIMGMGVFASTEIIVDNELKESVIVGAGNNLVNEGAIVNDYSPNLSGAPVAGSGNAVIIENMVNNIKNVGRVEGNTNIIYGVSSSNNTNTLGNGIVYNTAEPIGKIVNEIENYGVVLGQAEIEANKGATGTNKTFTVNTSGNAISAHQSTGAAGAVGTIELGDIKNIGIIKGEMLYTTSTSFPSDFTAELRGSGNGINVFSVTNNVKSIVGKIDNDGILSGNVKVEANISKDYRAIGNGISVYSSGTNAIEKDNTGIITNNGIIEGITEINLNTFGTGGTSNLVAIGNGISVYAASSGNTVKVSDILNTGRVTGSTSLKYDGANKPASFRGIGNGISVYNGTTANATVNDIINSGTITGEYSEKENSNDYIYLSNTSGAYGNGVYSTGKINNLKNTGLIAGSNNSIFAASGTNVVNYGVLAGQNIATSGVVKTNHGVEIILNSDGTVSSVENAIAGQIIDGKTVVNAEKVGDNDSFITAVANYSDKIINGVGTSNGVLNIASGKTTNLNNSIVNAYNTAVSLGGSATLNSTNTIFNGGGLDGKTAVINAVGGNNNVSVSGNSVINGNINLAGGNNSLTLGNSVTINASEIKAEGEDNVLNLGIVTTGKTENVLDIYGAIDGFKDINISGDVTLFETAKISGITDGTISLEDSSNLTLRVDVTEKDNEGNIIGHALYNTEAKLIANDISDNGGIITVAAAGVKQSEIISMGSTDISDIDDYNFETNSIIHEITKSEDGKNLEVVTDKNAPKTIPGSNYEYLNGLYKNIVLSDQADILAPTVTYGRGDKTKEEAEKGLSELLESLFTGNLATMSSNATRLSMVKFNEVAIDNPFIPKESQLLIDGGALYNSGESDFYFPETGDFNGNLEIDHNMFSGYGKLEYGYSDKTSFGTIFGGGKSKIENSFGSDLDGNSAYIGLYTKHKTNFWKWDIFAGVGYQYTDYEGARVSGNQYQSLKNDQEFSVKGYTMYAGARKSINLGKGFMWEPKAKMIYTSLRQGEINETGNLAMNIESQKIDYLETEFGANLRRDFNFKTGMGRARAGVAWNILFDNHLAGTMEANFISGGDSFELLVPQTDRTRVKIDLSYEFEKPTGWSYSLGTAYGHGKMTKDYTVRLGAGYKF